MTSLKKVFIKPDDLTPKEKHRMALDYAKSKICKRSFVTDDTIEDQTLEIADFYLDGLNAGLNFRRRE